MNEITTLSYDWVNNIVVKPMPSPNLDLYTYEEFEDTKGVIRIRKSKNRKHNDQKFKNTNSDQQSIHIKLKIE
jgi:hypothetical protein